MTRPLRVLFAIGSLYGGGSERQLVQLLQHVDRERCDPRLYLIYRSGELLAEVPPDVPVAAFEERDRAPRLYWPGRMHARRVNDLRRYLVEEQIDVIYDRTFHMTLITAPAARGAQVPRISTIVTDPRHDFRQIAGRFQALKYRLLRRAYGDADAVVSVSSGVAASARDFYRLEDGLITTVHNCIDLSRVDAVASGPAPFVREHISDRPDPFHVVAAGRLHPQKGFASLLAAMDDLVHTRGHDRLRLHLLGSGPDEQVLRESVSTRNLENHVFLEGYQTNAAAWFRHADLFCLSSAYEGMPNALLEAMACGVPVLATDCPHGPRELLDDGRLGRLVPANSAEELAAGIEDVMTNYAAACSLTAAARDRVEREFALPVGVRKLEDLFESVSARR